MAQDGRIEKVENKGFLESQVALLFDERTTTGSSEWVSTKLAKGGSLEVILSGEEPTVSLALYGSNSIEQPKSSFDGTKIGSDISASGLTAVTMQCRWMKAKIATLTGEDAAVTARLHSVH